MIDLWVMTFKHCQLRVNRLDNAIPFANNYPIIHLLFQFNGQWNMLKTQEECFESVV